MAQLRQDYPRFQAFDTQVLVILPNGPLMIARHVRRYAPPYPILTDQGARVAQRYGVEVRSVIRVAAFTPTVLLVDRAGKVRYTNYSKSYIREPDNNEPLAVLARMTG